jgi:sortase A
MIHMKLVLRWTQRLLMVAGVLLLGVYVGTSFHAAIMSHIAANKFAAADASLTSKDPEGTLREAPKKVDFTSWSAKRVVAYEESLQRHFDPALAMMRIRRLGLEAPIFEGVDDLTLDRGVGHIPGTAQPGGMGNVAVAGHRDGFFRVLKDIALGDQIEVLTAGEKYTYSVDQIVIVLPNDVSVLESGSAKSLTMVTCYPFYFVGSAPKRYIVQALLLRSEVLPVSDRSSDVSARVAW